MDKEPSSSAFFGTYSGSWVGMGAMRCFPTNILDSGLTDHAAVTRGRLFVNIMPAAGACL